MSKIGLTQRQADLLAFIESRAADGLPTPSFDEMRNHLGLKAKSGVHRIIGGLEERGHIVRLRGHARSIGLIDQSEFARPFGAKPKEGLPRHVAEKLSAYCARRRLSQRAVLSAALEDYMERHP